MLTKNEEEGKKKGHCDVGGVDYREYGALVIEVSWDTVYSCRLDKLLSR